jgi:restriction system protein
MIFAACVFLSVFVVTSLLLWMYDFLFSKHEKYRRMAKRQYRRIQAVINTPPDAFHIMRKMNPLVFEELVVYAISRKRHWKAWHGDRYSGDGGIDGYARYRGRKYYIQDKRYSGVINPQHVKSFAAILSRDRVMGIFVHTGRTGKGSQETRSGRMVFVSGNRLLELMDKREKYFLFK